MTESGNHLQTALKSQYHAAMGMLMQAVEKCPEDLWLGGSHPNAFWHVAYHAAFFTDFYLQPNHEVFRPWQHHIEGSQFLGPVPGNPQIQAKKDRPYSKAQIIDYLRSCDSSVDGAVDRLDLSAPESGFPWYKMSKVEHQFVNLRHLQHHTAQLIDRLRRVADIGIGWIGAGSKSRE
jgi:hypothetical protein